MALLTRLYLCWLYLQWLYLCWLYLLWQDGVVFSVDTIKSKARQSYQPVL
jgi:hypothetical protein